MFYLFFHKFFFLFIISIFFFSSSSLALANNGSPLPEDEKDVIERNVESLEEDLSSLNDSLDSLEDARYFFKGETIINSFGYKGELSEDLVEAFDYYNLRPVKSGLSFSNRFEFRLAGRLNYDLMADLRLESYSFSGDPYSFWGVPPPYGNFAGSKEIPFTFGHLNLRATDPDITAGFGTFYPSSWSDLVYSPPVNSSVYGPELLPARGCRLGFSLNPLSFELIGGIQEEQFSSYLFDKDNISSPFFAGGRGRVSFEDMSFGFSLLHSERDTGLQDSLSLDTKISFSDAFDFSGELCRSIFYNSSFNEDAYAFRFGLEGGGDSFLFKGDYIWVSPSYDPAGFHRNFSRRELLGSSRIASNRKGVDLYVLFPFERGEFKGEFIYFSQIHGGYSGSQVFSDPLFSPSLGEPASVTSFQSSVNYCLTDNIEMKGDFEFVRLFRSSGFDGTDFSQTTYLFETDFRVSSHFTLGGGFVYVKRKGFWNSSIDASQVMPLLKGEAEVSDFLSLSIEYRGIISKDFLSPLRDYDINQTTVRAVISF